MGTTNPRNDSNGSTSNPTVAVDYGMVVASQATIDATAAWAFLATVINPDTALPYIIGIVFEDEPGAQAACDFRDANGDPVVIDARTYREELPFGSRVVELAEFAGVVINLPRYTRACRLADDLRTNNGIFESGGGFLKDQGRFPLSFVALIRAAWNTVTNLGGDSAEERRELFQMYAHPTTVYLAPDATRTPVPTAELDALAKGILAPFFADSGARWCHPRTTWMQAQLRRLNQEWEQGVARQRRVHQQAMADWKADPRRVAKPRRWAEPQCPTWKFTDLPDQWWWSIHPLTLAGYVRQLLRAWGTDAEIVEEIRQIVKDWLEHFAEVEESAPSLTKAQKCIRRTFRYGPQGRLIGRYLEVTDSRHAPKCWTVRRGKEIERADMLIARDLRTGQVAIMCNPGNTVDALVAELEEVEAGQWALVTKLRDAQSRIRPHVFNGGWSRRVTVTQLTADQLIKLVQKHVGWDKDVQALPAERKPRKTGREAFGTRNQRPRYSPRARQVLPRTTLADTTAAGVLQQLERMVAKVNKAKGGKGKRSQRGGRK